MTQTYQEKLKSHRIWSRDARNRAGINKQKIRWTLRIKLAAFSSLGNRCSNPSCSWKNSDGTFGCTDHRILQIDHVHGDGNKERKSGNGSNSAKIYIKIIRGLGKGKYQLLCANCNWLKRYDKERQSCSNRKTK